MGMDYLTRWLSWKAVDSQTNQPSSSSLRDCDVCGAPLLSAVGRLTYPPLPKGFRAAKDDIKPVRGFVLTGVSGPLRDHPSELMESRNEAEAISSIMPFQDIGNKGHPEMGQGIKQVSRSRRLSCQGQADSRALCEMGAGANVGE